MKCSANIQEMEKLLKEIKIIGNILLNIEMYERWGGGRDESMNREVQKATEYEQEKSRLQDKLTTLSEGALSQDIEAWSDAHIVLLKEFIQESEKSDSDRSTNIFVAKEEIEEWKKVKKREIPFVQQNVYYIWYNSELYDKFFS